MSDSLRKEERLCSRKLIDRLFNGGESRSLSAFPVRAVYMLVPQTDRAKVKMLVSVPKRHFKRAVKRNRAKRQLREAFRRNKQFLDRVGAHADETLLVAFIWLSDQLADTPKVDDCMRKIMQRINEKL